MPRETKAATCHDTQVEFSNKVDECINQVREVYPIQLHETYELWEIFGLCQSAAEARKPIVGKELDDLRVCVDWIASHKCSEIGTKIHDIQKELEEMDPQKKKGYPPHPKECDAFISRLVNKLKGKK